MEYWCTFLILNDLEGIHIDAVLSIADRLWLVVLAMVVEDIDDLLIMD